MIQWPLNSSHRLLGTPSMLSDMDVSPFWPPFWHSGNSTRSFWGSFSHPPIPKWSFVVLKLPILTKFDLLAPNSIFLSIFLGSNFQRPVAHPHQFSDWVPPGIASQLPLSSQIPRWRAIFNGPSAGIGVRGTHFTTILLPYVGHKGTI